MKATAAGSLRRINSQLALELRRLRLQQRTLERSRGQYAELFDFAPVPYVLLDGAGMIVAINLAGCRLFNIERAHLIEHAMLSLVYHDDRREFLEHLRRCRDALGAAETELRLQARHNGHLVMCRLHSKRTLYDGRIVFPTVIVDHSERISLDDARLAAERGRDHAERQADMAKAAIAGKDRFLAIVSHELRTPLTPALFAASRLSAWEELPEQARHLAATIKRNIEFEARLIDDLLDIARINSNRVNLKLEPVDLHEVAREAIKICRTVAGAKCVGITAHFVADSYHVVADRARLRQVFWNLLNNAIKFTDAGGSVILVSANISDAMIRVSIRDTGAGMDALTLRNVFVPFDGRLETDQSRAGLGLGLAICKGIVGAHGGQIWASSEGRGLGATFAVELSTTESPEQRIAPFAQPTSVHDEFGHSQRILIVEDDGDSSDMLAQFLSHHGYRVEVVSSIHAALNRLGERWDILLSDIGLPDGSGLEIARRARQMPHPPHRLIAFTGFGSSEDIQASRDAGFDAHVVKPIDADSLLHALSGSVEPHQRH